MASAEDRRAAATKFQRIDAAFRAGDLAALREAVDDPSVVPNGRISDAIGSCLVYAIYHSPVTFIRTLLEAGADANAPADDGFPPLIAALTSASDAPGAPKRSDVDEIVRLLLSFGADANQRGTNDYTALHMAAAVNHPLAVQMLLDAGADPELRTRIDDCETPLELAAAAGRVEVAHILARRGQPLRQRLRSGLTLLSDMPGSGEPVRRQRNYQIRLRMWLNGGAAVRWRQAWGMTDVARLEDDGETLVTEVRIDRRSLINGLFYGVDGMRVGGTRRLEISPHLAYGDGGIPDLVPPRAVLVAEITILAASAR